MNVIAWRCIGGALIVAALVVLFTVGGLRAPRMPADLAGWRTLTGLVVGTLFTAAIAYTAVARIFGGNEATISACVQDWSRMWPVIPAVVFFLLGHIFFPVRN